MADCCAKCRRSFTIRFKWQAISEIDALVQCGLTISQASDLLHIHHWYYACWKKTIKAVHDLIEQHEDPAEVKKLHPGCPSLMNIIISNLSCSIFELHKQGLLVNPHMVCKEASRLSLDFKNMTRTAKFRCVHCFVKNLSISRGVNTCCPKQWQGDRGRVSLFHPHDEEQVCWHGSGRCDQHRLDAHTIFLPLVCTLEKKGERASMSVSQLRTQNDQCL